MLWTFFAEFARVVHCHCHLYYSQAVFFLQSLRCFCVKDNVSSVSTKLIEQRGEAHLVGKSLGDKHSVKQNNLLTNHNLI